VLFYFNYDGENDKVALNDNWVISAADGSEVVKVRIRIPTRSAADTLTEPRLILVAA
jgi:hypothetical protein